MGLITFINRKFPGASKRLSLFWHKLVAWGASRYPRITGFVVSNSLAVVGIPNRLRDRGSLYPQYKSHNPRSLSVISLRDPASNFFLRLIMERNYLTVVEVGTFSGERIISLKKLVPGIKAYGVDIGPSFIRPFLREGVQFALFNAEFFKSIPENSLIISNGTLTCMSLEEVKNFFSLIHTCKCDLAVCEPCAFIEPVAKLPSPRRNAVSFFHAYNNLALEAGLVPLFSYNQAANYTYAPENCEGVYLNLLSRRI